MPTDMELWEMELQIKSYNGEEGCLIDGHWGQYGVARMVEIAREYGYNDVEIIEIARKKMFSMQPSDSPQPTDDEEETLSGAAYSVESWLNENVALDGFQFGWHDSEFFYMSNKWWEEESI